MLSYSTFHHIGVAVFELKITIPYYENAGYSISEIILEPVQRVKVAYAKTEGTPTIELLEPLDPSSPICTI